MIYNRLHPTPSIIYNRLHPTPSMLKMLDIPSPEYRVVVICYCPAGSRRFIIADGVNLYVAWLAMLHYVAPCDVWVTVGAVDYYSPVCAVDFIIHEY
jgi:hypothetical protein